MRGPFKGILGDAWEAMLSRWTLVGLLICTAGLSRAAAAQTESSETPVLAAAVYGEDDRLAAWLWAHNPDVIEARANARGVAAEATRARLLPNPALDMTWGTIPVGQTNPPGLASPMTHVPNYVVGLTQPFEVGKRLPRRTVADANTDTANAQSQDVFAGRFFDLLDSIGRIARAQSRLAAYDALVASSEELLKLQRARASKGDIAVLDLTRAEVDQQLVLVAQSTGQLELAQALADCSAIAAAQCSEFSSGETARAWLRSFADMPLPERWTAEVEGRRADFRALEAAARAARALAELGRAYAYPDLGARLGYTYDTFTVSGNQAQSISVGVVVTLPVFSRGQADIQAAAGQTERVQEVRAARTAAGRAALAAAARRRDLSLGRTRKIDEALMKASSVLTALTEAMRRGSASLGDVLQARRAHQELLLERLDLDNATFSAVLDARRAAALYPQPPR